MPGGLPFTITVRFWVNAKMLFCLFKMSGEGFGKPSPSSHSYSFGVVLCMLKRLCRVRLQAAWAVCMIPSKIISCTLPDHLDPRTIVVHSFFHDWRGQVQSARVPPRRRRRDQSAISVPPS